MRIAFVSIAHFQCAVEIQRNPRLADVPLIVGDAEQPKRVLDHSLTTKQIEYGMTIRNALGLCPEAEVVPPDPILYLNTWESIIEALMRMFPEVEDHGFGGAYVNVSGLQLHYADDRALAADILATVKEASGLSASVGIAEGKFAAFAAGMRAPEGEAQFVQSGSERRFLAPLSVWLLPFDRGITSRLQLLGLDEIGDVAALSIVEMQSQFGFDGQRLWELANGIDRELLRPTKHPEMLQAGVELEAAVAGIDVMVAVARQLLSRLKLPLRGRAARELTLQAELISGRSWQNQVVFRDPVSEDERLAFVMRSALTNYPPPQAINSLSLRLSNLTGETGHQLHLGQKRRQQRLLEGAISQLKARYGYSPIYRCVDVEPWSAIPEERQILVESDV